MQSLNKTHCNNHFTSHCTNPDDADNTAHRSDHTLHCQLNAVRMEDDFNVPHCQHTALQFGHVDAVHNRSAVLVEGCCNNATDHIIYARSRLMRQTDDGRQLSLEQTQLRAYQPDDIGHNEIDLLLTEMPVELVNALNEPITPDTLPWTEPAATAVRSYEAWDVFLWNAHKLGLEYLAFAAPRLSGRLVPVVDMLRRHVREMGGLLTIDWMTGYVGETELSVETAAATGDKVVKVPKYVWLVVATADNAAVAYLVPNGANGSVGAELCADRCEDERVHCCAVTELFEHVPVLRDVFGKGVELL